ncbi:oxidoreductase 2-nitropropane dioxygenase family, putative [Talaromyces stipitatus ATCC 10500]|uniref:Oxidoreductase 2-nitropropane dioxygenase family, putative n=1 Tax=Talaromyces stipitatus (strain ATCC 10500 / CBS 375.48 / QM 6759 / NRRL 1006) TaxID=441959 RepID=B8LWV5_TALSN|nr:oxidoreductase 2-nitropropane dioxygenase family, putative [Talaromyces stipitatus ATCC 10500]EED24588.1 oxidoreductase 2-nitropropane dioxygenase family, putative [Talaromyces stipitatus ATCC 10500]
MGFEAFYSQRSNASGGLGFIGPSAKTQDTLLDLREASALVPKTNLFSSFVPSSDQVLPVGIGFQLWCDDIQVAADSVKEFKPCAAWLYAPRNGQKDLDKWSLKIRTASPQTQIWIQIGTLAEVKELLRGSQLPDVIVVQGSESGGHGRTKDGLGLISLLPEVADVTEGSQIPLVAAGGIADGRGAAAALCLGASGIAMGTRFLAATETRISRGYQNEVVRANDGAVNTTRTLLYNHLRGTFGWPEGYSPRTIINKSYEEQRAGVPFEELKKRHEEAQKAGDSGWGPDGRLATYAGASIGLVREVKDAAAIVDEVQKSTLRIFTGLTSGIV